MSHMSRTSTRTEMTFPIRADAYSATNLLHRSEESGPAVFPPNLPYPSLVSAKAHSTGQRNGGKGFFAAIGRRASVKRERPQPSQPSYRPLAHPPKGSFAPPPRSIVLEKVPTLPGGPRAIPRRSSVPVTSMPLLFGNMNGSMPGSSFVGARLKNVHQGGSGLRY
ncbi:uncharacterized protein EI90DRAFT_3054666 [Cantharellus anzutake]|nr:uncharacterized protein EI90DRAFT_3054666 [Cantharellus anzutake]KAF8332863.1 hypothetical protein EI90DRAFT_3054666 [Cantharellus anzutake]